MSNVKGAQELSKNEQKKITGSVASRHGCKGDGSFIFIDGVKVCCFDPESNGYIC